MITIVLKDFRCWSHLSVKIPLNKITLIRGCSGTGKTTLFQAIAWVLFGHLKMITPITSDKAKTSVTLTLPYQESTLFIQRSRSPNRLLVRFQDKEYVDKMAQALLDQFFGDHDLWHVTSYLTQVCRNEFLTYSVQAKMDLLHSISFQQENPAEVIEKIDEAIATAQQNYQSLLTSYEYKVQVFTKRSQGQDIVDVPSSEAIDSWRQELTDWQSKLIQLQEQATERRVQLGALQRLRARVKDIVAPMCPPIVQVLGDYSLSAAHSWVSILDQIVAKEQKRGVHISAPPQTYSPQEIEEARSKERERALNLKLAQTLNIDYTAEAIANYQAQIRYLLDHQPQAQAQARKRELQSRLDRLTPTPKPELPTPPILPIFEEKPYDTTILQHTLSELLIEQASWKEQAARGSLNCPQCQAPLNFTQGTLFFGEGQYTASQIAQEQKRLTQAIANTRAAIERMHSQRQQAQVAHNHQLQRLQQRFLQASESFKRWEWQEEQRQKEVAEVQAQYDQIEVDDEPYHLLSISEVQQLQQALAQMERIVIFPELTVSSSTMSKYATQAQAAERYALIQQEIDMLRAQLPSEVQNFTGTYLRSVITSWQDYLHQVNRYNALIQEQAQIQSEIAAQESLLIPDPTNDVQQAQAQITTLNNQISQGEEAQYLLAEYDEIETLRAQVTEAHGRLVNFRSLKDQAVAAECRVLDAVVEAINQSINDVCQTIFDREIALELQLFKTSKSTSTTRHNVHFAIRYRGGVFDHLSQLSMGEGDRVSLALTLALNRLSSCPFLLLDETLRSLDIDRKESVIRAIRENYGATALLIMHDGVEGMFDHIINLEEYDK